MKTIIYASLAAAFAWSLVGCGGSESPPANAPAHTMDMSMADGGAMPMRGMDHSNMPMDHMHMDAGHTMK